MKVVFSDFDGTITARETFVEVLRRFAPEAAERLIGRMYTLEVPLREGVRAIVRTIPSDRYPQIIDHVRHAPTWPGLVDLLDFLDARGVPFVVVSGGFRGIVEAVLGPLLSRIHAVHAAEVATSGSHLDVSSPFEDDTELVSKVRVMEAYPATERVAIGDSVTDLSMALAADLVFARDRLCRYLDERARPHLHWRDFLDVRDALDERWGAALAPGGGP